MSEWQALWSYVHADDDAESGRIAQLARDIVAQFEMLSGEQIRLFLDRDAISWGENWRNRIDESLSSIAFFIPVITRRYFQSPECRRELRYFATQATNIGIREIVLPLLYIDFHELHEDSPQDDLVGLVRTFQWEDWTDLRFAERASEPYRRNVAHLAMRLSERLRTSEKVEITATPEPPEEGEQDTGPGSLDRLAMFEEALPNWSNTLEALGEQVQTIGNLMEKGKSAIDRADAQGKGFAGRLTIAKRLASELGGPVEQIWSLAKDFSTQLFQVDDGLRIIIEVGPSEARGDSEATQQLCEFFETIRNLSSSSHEGLSATKGLVEAISPLEAMSRDLRAPLRKLRQGLTTLVEARDITDEWVHLIDSANIECIESS